jgi:hypothetical protein
MLANTIVCEYTLPIPSDDFTEDEREYFKDIQWNELGFYTASFFDRFLEEELSVLNYIISEDGLFYKGITNIELSHNSKGEIETNEKDGGLERLDFTGEIFFGTEIFGKDYDYAMTFRALFYKGDLKELDLDEWQKRPNDKRKKAEETLLKTFREENEKANKRAHKISYLLRRGAFKLVGVASWCFLILFKFSSRVQRWIIE